MADLFIPPGYASVACRFAIAGQANYRSITFGVDTSSGPIDTQDCCDDLATAIRAGSTGLFEGTFYSTTSSFVEVYMLRNVAGAMQAAITPIGVTGTRSSSGTLLPPQVSVTLKKRTAQVGKRFRGRCYLPNCFLTDADVDNGGVVDGGRYAELNTGAAEVLSQMAAADLPMVLLHSESPLVPNLVTSWTCSLYAATQRRRLRR